MALPARHDRGGLPARRADRLRRAHGPERHGGRARAAGGDRQPRRRRRQPRHRDGAARPARRLHAARRQLQLHGHQPAHLPADGDRPAAARVDRADPEERADPLRAPLGPGARRAGVRGLGPRAAAGRELRHARLGQHVPLRDGAVPQPRRAPRDGARPLPRQRPGDAGLHRRPVQRDVRRRVGGRVLCEGEPGARHPRHRRAAHPRLPRHPDLGRAGRAGLHPDQLDRPVRPARHAARGHRSASTPR